MFTVHPAESAGSSPTKSPSKKGIAADAAQSVFNLNPQAPTFGSFGAPGVAGPPVFQGNPSKRPLFPAVPPSNVTLGAVPSQGDNINAVHNTPETNPATGTSLPNAWHIPAVHSRGAAPTGSTLPRRPASPTTTKPGAAARVGRRDAWMRFMAYEGSVQICLDFVLQGVTEPAVQFLADGCRELRQALGIGQLLLSRAASGDAAEAAIYWDDRDDTSMHMAAELVSTNPFFDPKPAAPAPAVLPTTPPKPRNPSLDPRPADHQAAEDEQDSPPMEDAASVERSPVREGDAQFERGGFAASEQGLGSEPTFYAGPFVEAKVVRVVGCPFLAGYGSNVNSTKDEQQRHCILMHHTGMPGDQGAWTTLTPTGGIHTPGSMRLPPDAPRGTVIVQLVSGTHPLATGTVQVAELQRVAAECDALATDAPHHSSRFLSNLVPSSWRRWEQGSTMLWVRMVDGNGAEAGHVVLSAKVVPGEAFLHGGLNNHAASVAPMSSPSGEPSAAGSPAPSATIERAATPIPMPPPPPPLSKEATHRPPSAASPAAVPRPYQQPPPAFDQIMRASVQGGPLTRTQTAGGFLQAKAQHVYDVLLDSALAAAGCGPAALLLQGPWAWLAGQFAQRYNVRQQYVTLAHLTWVVRPGIAAPTATCFRTLVSELAPLIAERERLISAELALLTHVLERVNALLTTCFEAYFALNEDSKGGLADGVLSVRSPGTPPALAPAVALLELTRGDLTGSEGVTAWLTARLRTAARKRFQGLLAATEARRGVVNESRIGLKNAAKEDEAALWAYLRMEELCTGIMNELRADDVIQASGAMPTSVRLPEVTAVEYVRGCTAHLQRTLQRHPPPAPTPPAVQLVEAVGRLQSFVERHGYAEALARLSSKEIFGGFVQEWVAGSAVSLRRTLRALDHAGPPALIAWADLRAGPSNRVAPLVEGMLMDVEKEMQLYERIVGHWPVHAMELEAALVAVLREATSAASRQCGLVQTKEEHPAIGAENGASQGGGAQRTPRGGRVAWRWVAVGAAPANAANDVPQPLRKGINPYQALLLNSLRRLLALVPQLEHTLTGWCGGAAALPQESLAVFPPPSAGAARVAQEAPDLGAHWAQLVKELRTEYYACITLCAESLAGELAASSATSLAGLLRREALTTAPASVGKHARRVLENTATTLRCLAAGLDGRVFVALGRGLWDLAARDVLRYAEDLSEGGTSGAWRGRQSAGVAMRALDTFYRAELAAAMGSDLHNRDLMPPQHAQRAAALLADNSADINNSFDVY